MGRNGSKIAISTGRPGSITKGHQRVIAAQPQGIRRLEVRFRQPETDSAHLPGTRDGGRFEEQAGSEPEEQVQPNEHTVDNFVDGNRHFVRQPVKILLVPRCRLVQ